MNTNQTTNVSLAENFTEVPSNVSSFPESDGNDSVYLSRAFLKTVFGSISLTGVVGNLLVILVIVRVKLLRTHTNFYILNQSCVDLLGSILLAGLYCSPSITHEGNLMGVALCKIWSSTYLLWACFNASTLNLVFLTFERYMGVVHPVLHYNKFTVTKVKVMIAMVWTLPFAWLSYWAAVNTVIDGGCYPLWPNESAQKAIGVMAFLVSYLIPLFVMTFTYLKIFLVLRRQTKIHHTDEEGTGSQSNNQSRIQKDIIRERAKRNVVKTLVIIFVTYVICWSPNQIEYFRFNMGASVDLTSVWFKITVIMAFCNVCVNPVIYSLKYQEFRDGLKKLFCKSSQQVQHLNIGVQEPVDLPAGPSRDTGI
ncbi:trace amine-associated receptor 1-like isoform X2 [Ptychodera flava]